MPKSNKPQPRFIDTHVMYNSNGNVYDVMLDPNFVSRDGLIAMVICHLIFEQGNPVDYRLDNFIVCEIRLCSFRNHTQTHEPMSWFGGEYDMTIDQAFENRAKRFRG